MQNSTAAILIIGNEILSGRTLDTNTQDIAVNLNNIGVSLMETRTVPDDTQAIVNAVNALRTNYDCVFTSGGIGPTHDDITSESIAKALGVKLIRDQTILKILQNHYNELGEELNSAREKMAFVPEGSSLIYNSATKIPGFYIENIFALAGIPNIMNAMLVSCLPLLKQGQVIKTKSLVVNVGESKIANQFEKLQNKYPEVSMGSYPFVNEGQYGTTLVLRSNNYDSLDKSYDELVDLMNKVTVK